MKVLTGKNPFRDLIPKCYHKNGREQYYTTEHHCFLQNLYPLDSGNEMFLNCRLLCRTRSWTGDHHRRVNPPFLNIGFVHSGETVIRSNNTFLIAEPGDAFVLLPGTDYELLTLEQCERSAILVCGTCLTGLLSKSNFQERVAVTLPDPGILQTLFDRLGLLLQESYRHPARREISNICFEILQLLNAPEEAVPYPECLKPVIEKIGKEYSNPLNIGELAEHAGISASGLTRLFKKYLKKTPYQYLIEIRMHQAARMLEQHSLSIKEIAEKVGYSNPLNFSTEFRKKFGRSPKKFQ